MSSVRRAADNRFEKRFALSQGSLHSNSSHTCCTRMLLVAIAFFYTPARLSLLKLVLDNFCVNYIPLAPTITIDTNSNATLKHLSYFGVLSKNVSVDVLVHDSLIDPFQLTWMHRARFLSKVNEYDWFLYCEDDMFIPFPNFVNYQRVFHEIWPRYVPGFLRIEFKSGEPYVLDVTTPACPKDIITVAGQKFANFNRLYHAFWALPGTILRRVIADAGKQIPGNRPFNRHSFLSRYKPLNKTHYRESAAALPTFQLRIPALVKVINGTISPSFLCLHLANNYADENHRKFSRVHLEEVLSKSCDLKHDESTLASGK